MLEPYVTSTDMIGSSGKQFTDSEKLGTGMGVCTETVTWLTLHTFDFHRV